MKVRNRMKQYKIEVFLLPEERSWLYFWCLLVLSGDGWCNSGHGWAPSPEKAWTDARAYHRRCYASDI